METIRNHNESRKIIRNIGMFTKFDNQLFRDDFYDFGHLMFKLQSFLSVTEQSQKEYEGYFVMKWTMEYDRAIRNVLVRKYKEEEIWKDLVKHSEDYMKNNASDILFEYEVFERDENDADAECHYEYLKESVDAIDKIRKFIDSNK